MDSNTIGSRIRKLRKSKGVTQDDVAEYLNVKRQTIQLWESDERDLKTQYTISLAEYFGVSCDELLRDRKAENIGINKRMGLSDKSILLIESEIKPNIEYSLIFNTLIENGSVKKLCEEIRQSIINSIELETIVSSISSDINSLNDEIERQMGSLALDNFLNLIKSVYSTSEERQEFRKYMLVQIVKDIVDTTLQGTLIKDFHLLQFKEEHRRLIADIDALDIEKEYIKIGNEEIADDGKK